MLKNHFDKFMPQLCLNSLQNVSFCRVSAPHPTNDITQHFYCPQVCQLLYKSACHIHCIMYVFCHSDIVVDFNLIERTVVEVFNYSSKLIWTMMALFMRVVNFLNSQLYFDVAFEIMLTCWFFEQFNLMFAWLQVCLTNTN